MIQSLDLTVTFFQQEDINILDAGFIELKSIYEDG